MLTFSELPYIKAYFAFLKDRSQIEKEKSVLNIDASSF
jgi:hypothetical protein